jgi:hypothetical protein
MLSSKTSDWSAIPILILLPIPLLISNHFFLKKIYLPFGLDVVSSRNGFTAGKK